MGQDGGRWNAWRVCSRNTRVVSANAPLDVDEISSRQRLAVVANPSSSPDGHARLAQGSVTNYQRLRRSP